MEPNYTTESPIRSSLDSTAQRGHANGADWQEETYQKIKTMKDLYLPEISEMYQKIAAKLQQHDSLPQQSKSDQLEKLKVFKTMLERIITFLQVSKNNISPGYKEKLGSYEKQIVNFINTNRPKRPALQQGQLPAPHTQSVLSHENQINLQFQSMNLQDNSMSD
ncbi:mediator of RNA polymerase II transcription subunit 15a isoform X1 [Quercus suber]|uniref:Mediator of rna polymerase ii transcription subunit 15a n=1 Tax=Quercus suber TaxID=58331 RepID=A0AAW0M4S4_QUESU|nr:mediator of RNA polymerase II transcription subunit 15a-like isoform X1 [Quercus suber]POE44987.1 mediator of rna polymerase ii transcription subunit 15a [Quercus suber]